MVCLLLSTALLAAPQDTVAVPLEDAVARVLAVGPTIAAATGAINAPKGLRAETFWPFPTNPTFEYGRTKRQSPSSTTHDTEWVIAQEIEIGGQWIFRHCDSCCATNSSTAIPLTRSTTGRTWSLSE